jgi:hypothetical protein
LTKNQPLAQAIADDLVHHLDTWYSLPETYDDEVDRQIHEWYANAPRVFPKRPYFSPSAVNACPRELFYKAKSYPKDVQPKQPHQGRWTEIGTAVGDIMQRAILLIERNYEDKTGESPRFKFERNEDGTPMFEEFAKKNHKITHNGKTFYLYGTCDGIMQYRTPDGEWIRVGLEIKSKQTTPAKTSHHSMRNPEEKHVKQCVAYSLMYDVDLYVILYVNTAHKSWSIPSDEYEKSPDIRAFGVHITEDMQLEVLDRLATIQESIDRNEPMPLDLEKFTFNKYKEAIVKELTEVELNELREYANRVIHSNLPAFRKNVVYEAIEEIERLREAV